ncbi:MAG: AAA family ATPase, partial [Gammaproteobacteria bacterium]|nr:AAA family ATPase [Gammaproteobacteria bacterium]
MNRRQLPIGIQDFRTIREDHCYYVDKTALIRQLVQGGRHYFLSRPRRFGKSLLLDTLRELFECNEPLFRGLDIHQHWDWNDEHPVVRLSFDGKYNEPGELAKDILLQLAIAERNLGVDPPPGSPTGPGRLRYLLDGLHRKTG